MALTRADLEASRLQQLISQSDLGLVVLSETQLQASIDLILQRHNPTADLWVFGYGSLIWNPCFHFVERRVGKIYGWHRCFCLWAHLGRGTPDNPALMLGLERGGSCQGVAFRIAAAEVPTELLLIWRREMVVNSYIPRWVKVYDGTRSLEAVTFTINPQNPDYAGQLTSEQIIQSLATACGQLGNAADYLRHTVDSLAEFGIRDRHLDQLCDRVLERQRQCQGL